MTNYKETKEWYERTAMLSAAVGLGAGMSGWGAVTFTGHGGQKNLVGQAFLTMLFYVGGGVASAMLWTYIDEL